jgi:hypothetical protein
MGLCTGTPRTLGGCWQASRKRSPPLGPLNSLSVQASRSSTRLNRHNGLHGLRRSYQSRKGRPSVHITVGTPVPCFRHGIWGRRLRSQQLPKV